MTETMTRGYEQTLATTRQRLEAAPQALAIGQPVLYYVQEHTNLGGRHGAFALHNPATNEMHVTIPQQNTEIIMTLHALEAVLHGVVSAQAAGTEVEFPSLQLRERTALPTHELSKVPQLIRVSLNVNVPHTHLIVTHKNFRSKDLSLEQIVEQYYQLLIERLRAQTVAEILTHYPVNTMLVHAARGSEMPDKNKIGLVVNGHKDHSRDQYSLVYPGKINGLHWRHAEERNS